MATGESNGLWSRVKQWLGVNVETVPADIAACEFDCRKTVCDDDTLEQCERRQHAASAELAARGLEADDPARPAAVAADHPATVN